MSHHRLRSNLLSQAPLFDDPHAYRAGVVDALDTGPDANAKTLKRKLFAQASLFDGPHAYRAGVKDALDARRASLT